MDYVLAQIFFERFSPRNKEALRRKERCFEVLGSRPFTLGNQETNIPASDELKPFLLDRLILDFWLLGVLGRLPR